ncbi:hypothetical protein PENFLA_c014G10170 [Penicillium flavigenum]|uniref:Uncharacterized protein n=1 Tax=Penicillium flavigenum TaxID=254877 RepID=A0A1V6T5K8_9EURO|nr:hypothetical protein PENFLA_c014G10170 [Penicillium flavigenum]
MATHIVPFKLDGNAAQNKTAREDEWNFLEIFWARSRTLSAWRISSCSMFQSTFTGRMPYVLLVLSINEDKTSMEGAFH